MIRRLRARWFRRRYVIGIDPAGAAGELGCVTVMRRRRDGSLRLVSRTFTGRNP